MHGKVSGIRHDSRGCFKNIPQGIASTRYHSLSAGVKTLPKAVRGADLFPADRAALSSSWDCLATGVVVLSSRRPFRGPGVLSIFSSTKGLNCGGILLLRRPTFFRANLTFAGAGAAFSFLFSLSTKGRKATDQSV